MTAGRPDLAALTAEVLAELTNAGTVRRAVKELDAGASFTFTVDPTAEGDVVTAVDGEVTCVLGTAAFDTWTCTCVTGERCRHVVRAVLDWQRRGAPPGPVPGDADADAEDGADAGAGADAGDGADAGADAGAGGRSPAPVLPVGLVAEVSVGATQTRVRLLHPEHVSVRFLVGRDPRYARCECAVPGCAHLGLAGAALDHRPDPGTGLVTGAAVPVAVPAAWRARWRRWAAQLLDLGLPAAAELMAGAVRLATEAEGAGLAHPAAVLREVAEQLELRCDHSSRLSPVRLVELVGEVEARLRALELARLPGPLVAGTPPARLDLGKVRLAGLGADYRQVGGWHELRAYVADTGTGAVRTVTLTRTDTADVRHTPADLALVRHRGTRMVDWAAGRGLLPSARRVDDELMTPRGRWTMLAAPGLELDLSALAPTTGSADDVPAALGPRRPADGMGVIAVRGVDRIAVAADTVTARLVDPAGVEAVLHLRPDPLAGDAARRLAETLSGGVSGPVTAVAGRWRPSSDGPAAVSPTAVWSAAGVLLPQLGISVGADGTVVRDAVRYPDPLDAPEPGDPWQEWWSSLADVLGRLLVTGLRRGTAAAVPALRECAAQAEGLGLGRCSALVGRIADRPGPDTVLDAAVLLALAG